MNPLEAMRKQIMTMSVPDKLRLAIDLLEAPGEARGADLALAIIQMATIDLHREALAELAPAERIP
jgi:hypothetical protein